ncbi:hypothetical protein P7K49_012211 [Saguinus oedipus]|uniref:Uncharacterized protein n=1 Tax=Saguinus oedipus TaxID=9490 RepID=A0ABQ9VUE8_SAGOE|nr:hypothetical protein P7K49_012211 [Saguinus oedipus]
MRPGKPESRPPDHMVCAPPVNLVSSDRLKTRQPGFSQAERGSALGTGGAPITPESLSPGCPPAWHRALPWSRGDTAEQAQTRSPASPAGPTCPLPLLSQDAGCSALGAFGVKKAARGVRGNSISQCALAGTLQPNVDGEAREDVYISGGRAGHPGTYGSLFMQLQHWNPQPCWLLLAGALEAGPVPGAAHLSVSLLGSDCGTLPAMQLGLPHLSVSLLGSVCGTPRAMQQGLPHLSVSLLGSAVGPYGPCSWGCPI